MRAILKTTNAVVISYAADLLSQEGIESIVFDGHASIMDGSVGILPRRLMVADDDFPRAQSLLREAIPEHLP
jgi:hypothetical protein